MGPGIGAAQPRTPHAAPSSFIWQRGGAGPDCARAGCRGTRADGQRRRGLGGICGVSCRGLAGWVRASMRHELRLAWAWIRGWMSGQGVRMHGCMQSHRMCGCLPCLPGQHRPRCLLLHRRRYVAEGSGNVAEHGMFSIQVGSRSAACVPLPCALPPLLLGALLLRAGSCQACLPGRSLAPDGWLQHLQWCTISDTALTFSLNCRC